MSSGLENGLTTQLEDATSTKPTGVRFPTRGYNDDWTRTLDAFEILATLGEGTFGWVQKAKDLQTGEVVALKKIKMENETEGFPITAIREIKILKSLRNQLKTSNVVVLKEVVSAPERDLDSDDKGSIYLVFEYFEHDLAGLMDMRWDTMFRPDSIKCFMKQLLEGLYALHMNKFIHRDIKASNLLVSNEGVLKIADFGLARPQCEEPHYYTANVITLWYRPPELLLCDKRPATVYSTPVDMWSAGCVLAEMVFHQPLFKGRTEVELLDCIFKVMGTPTPATHPELWPSPPAPVIGPNGQPQKPPPSPYEVWRKFKPPTIYPPRLKQMCIDHKVPENTYELLSALLAFDPAKRPTAFNALDHDWFWSDPLPCKPSEVGSCPPSNEYISKALKEQERKRHQALHPQQHHHHHHHGRPGQGPGSAPPSSTGTHRQHNGPPPPGHHYPPSSSSRGPPSHHSSSHGPSSSHSGGHHHVSSSSSLSQAHRGPPPPGHHYPPSTSHVSGSSHHRSGPPSSSSSSSSSSRGPPPPGSSVSSTSGSKSSFPPYPPTTGQTSSHAPNTQQQQQHHHHHHHHPAPPSYKPPPPASTPPPPPGSSSHGSTHHPSSSTSSSQQQHQQQQHHNPHAPNGAIKMNGPDPLGSRANPPPSHPAPSSVSTGQSHYHPSAGTGYKSNLDNPHKRFKTEEGTSTSGNPNGGSGNTSSSSASNP